MNTLKRRYYLNYIPIEEAWQKWQKCLKEAGFAIPVEAEKIKTEDSLDRISAEAVFAKISSPRFHASAMDGVAVRAEDTYGAMDTNPKQLKFDEQGVFVDTGDPVPKGFNAVIMIEDVNQIDKANFEIMKAASPWQYVRPMGEDVVVSELILPHGHKIRPEDIGAMLAGGVEELMARRKPRVGLIPTGTELSETVAELKNGQVIESNSRVLTALVEEWGAEPCRYSLIKDDYQLIKENILNALDENDIAVVNAGTSAGREDFTAPLIEELGELVVHGVALKPGRTCILGVIKGKPILGLSGYPVANYRHASTFLKPIIFELLGTAVPSGAKVTASLSRKVVSPLGLEEFVQTGLAKVGQSVIATPLSRGSGVTMSMVRSDGIVRVPRASEGFNRGSEVEVELKGDLCQVENTILAVGSHDISLDILADELRRRFPQLDLTSANVGSLAGLMAIKQGLTHIAGSHLLDGETGKYNLPYLKRLLPEKKVKLVTLVYREQGFIVPKGNPKGICKIEDLTGDDVVFINRQRDSGTRVLLDHELKKAKIESSSIKGYNREFFTHTAVAAAVQSGAADVALGVKAAAEALGLDFITLSEERYDLVIPQEFYDSENCQRLLRVISSEEFKNRVEAIGGYSTRETGNSYS